MNLLVVWRDVVHRLERNAVGQGRIAEDRHHVFIAAALVARRADAQRGGKRGAGVRRAVAIVLALRAQAQTRSGRRCCEWCRKRPLRPVSSLWT